MHFIQEAQVEVRVQCLSEVLPKSVQVCHALSIVKGHQAPLVVQVHSDPGQWLLQRQHSWRRCTSHVLYPIREGESPEAVGWEGFDDSLSGHRLAGHPHSPDCAAVDFNLPVVASVGEALAPKQRQGSVEPVGVVLNGVVKGLVADTGEGGSQAQPRVGCAGVKCDGCWNWVNTSFHGFPHSVLQGPCKPTFAQTGWCKSRLLKLQRWPANINKVKTIKREKIHP